jgi:precorrin-6A/cobalt-precorrin-6A reductase
MRAVVFSGTTEGRIFSRQLAQLGADVLVSVATTLGSEEQGSFAGITVHCGRLTPDEMAALVQRADLCVDATHPYAVDATRNIRTACRTAGVEYHRLLRAQSPLPAGSMVFQSAAHVADFLVQTQGNVLLATGPRNGCIPVCCLHWTALPPARPRTSPTRISLLCKGRSPTR